MQIPWKGHFKSEKSSVLQARNRSFVRRGFRRKVPFFLSSTKLPEVLQDIAFDALAPDCSIQVLPIFSEILSAIFMCVQLPGNRAFNHPTVCPRPAFRPKKNSFLRASSQLLHKLTAVVDTFCHLRHLLFEGSCPSFASISIASSSGSKHDVCVEVHEDVQQRSMTYVWKCQRTYYVVAVAMNINIPPHPPSTCAWPLTGVDTKNNNGSAWWREGAERRTRIWFCLSGIIHASGTFESGSTAHLSAKISMTKT